MTSKSHPRHANSNFLYALIVATLIFIVGASAQAQSVTGDVSGTVSDPNGAVLAGAALSIQNIGTGGIRTAITDKRGEFRIAFLPVADYSITVNAEGFTEATDNFKIILGENVVKNFTLKVQPIAGAVVMVVGEGFSVQGESPALGGLVGPKQVAELPLNGRSVDQLALLEPGVNSTTNRVPFGTIHGTQININGANARSNRFLLDGTSISDTFNNGLGSVANTFLGIDSVQEFRVLTNNYSAEHGQAMGGVVTIVTKSGTNAFHGSLFEYFRNDKLDARNFFDREKPGFKRNQFGGSLGGPIAKDGTFFFASAEVLRERLGLNVVTAVPSLDARRGRFPDPAHPGQFITVAVSPDILPYLSLFPTPNGRDFGTGLAELDFPFNRETNEQFLQFRVDHKFSSKNNFFGRYSFDDADRHPPANFPAWKIQQKSRNQFLTLEDTHVLSSDWVNTARFSFARTNVFSDDHLDASFPGSSLIIPGRPEAQLSIGGMPSTGGGEGPPRSSTQLQNLFSGSDDMSLVRGAHLLKWGVLFDYTQNLIETKSFLGGRFSFPGVQQFIQGRASNLTVMAPGAEPRQYLRHNYLGAYIQDSFKLRQNLTLTLGLREEFSTPPTEAHGKQVGLPDPLHDTGVTVGKLLENQKQNWAPRVGLAWDPWGDGKTSVRTGFGIFYDTNIIPYIAQKINGNPPFNSRYSITSPSLHPNLATAAVSIDVALPDYHWQTPHSLQYNLAVEREIRRDTVVTIAYAGSRGINLLRSGEINTPVPQVLANGQLFFSTTAPRRNPRIGAITLMRPDGDSWYNAAQLKVRSRLNRDFEIQGYYTFSRTIDNVQGSISGDSFGSQPLAWNPYNNDQDKGLSDFHRKHSFVGNGIWDLPFFKGQKGFAGAVLNGWSLLGIVTLESGNPFTPGIQADWTGTRFASDARGIDRPNLVSGFNADNIILGGPDQYFNTAAFALPLKGTFGNLGRNVLIGPGLATFDVSAHKNIPLKMLGDSGKLQLRMEAFNLFNHTNFSLPARVVFNGASATELPIGTAGRITSTTTSARQIQLALRLAW